MHMVTGSARPGMAARRLYTAVLSDHILTKSDPHNTKFYGSGTELIQYDH